MMKRGKHNLSHTRLLSCDLGELIPCGLTEVLPGDTIQHACSALVRASPLLAPVMHPVEVRIHHWFVPFRLIWDDFEKFITGGPDGMDASVFPTRAGTTIVQGSLPNYLGLPVGVVPAHSILPYRAYNLIWNENYRDEDLNAPLVNSTASGPDATTQVFLQNCAWEKDYLTSARPWEQKGPTVTIPLGTSAPVKGLGFVGSITGAADYLRYTTPLADDPTALSFATSGGSAGNQIKVKMTGAGASSKPDVTADLSNASAVTVTLLRQALALQRFEEARARYGSRYVEYLRYIGIRSSDARLARPEYLGGVRQTIQFSEVLQTAPGTDPVGDLKGHGIAGMRGRRYRRFFEEHGYVMSLLSVRPKTIYMSGMARTWNRRTKYDFFQKELEHIGQQPVLNKEVRAAHATPDGVFGYTNRYDEYRRSESFVAGEFATSLLNYWHLARDFASDPALNSSFTNCVPTERSFAVPAEDVLMIMVKHNMQARRIVGNSSSSYIY